MKTIFGGAALALVLLSGTTMSASAATTVYNQGSLGTFSSDDTSGDYLKINAAKQMFDLAYTFTLDVAGYVSATANNAYTTSKNLRTGVTTTTKISDFFLYVNGVQGLTTDDTAAQNSNYPPTSSLILLQPGTYALDITGTTGTPNSSVGLSFSFTAASVVPLPGTAALFGAALLGLGAFGAFYRKGKSVTA